MRYCRCTADRSQPPFLGGIWTSVDDTSGLNLGAQTTFLLTEADLLSFSYAFRNGTVTAVTPPNADILEYSSAVARDPVFSDTTRLIAYRIQAKTNTVSLGWSHALSEHAAVNVAYAYRRTRADSDLGDYYSNLINISVSYSR